MSGQPIVTIFASKLGTRINAARPMSLEEIERVIRKAPAAADKVHLPLLKLASFGPIKSEKGSLRHDANVETVHGVEGDYDGEIVPMEQAAETLSKHGVAAVLYTSARHTEENPRWRVLVPLSRPLEGDTSQLQAQRRHWTGVLNALLGGVLTMESFTLSQCYFFGPITGNPAPEIIRLSGCSLDEIEETPDPVYPANEGISAKDDGTHYDTTTDSDLMAVIGCNDEVAQRLGLSRRDAMLKVSARRASLGMLADDIEAVLLEALGDSPPPFDSNGKDPRRAAREIAQSAVGKFGETRRPGMEAALRRTGGAPIEEVPTTPMAAPAAIVLRHIADIVAELREPAWLDGLCDILERNVIAVLAGVRNTLKSFIALHWAMLAAVNGHAVVILTAEGAGLDRRVDAWMKTYAPAVDIHSLRVVALERALNLNLLETFQDLDQAIRTCGFTPDLMLIDTFSKYAAGLDENDNAAVAAFLALLSEMLRRRYECTIVLVAHAGHGDARRPRGASVLMANPDAEFIVERPEPTGFAVTVSRERFKDAPALAPLNYTAEIVDLGRLDSRGRAVTSLVLKSSDAPSISATKQTELRGGAQRQLLNALRAAKATPGTVDIWTIGDIREIGRKAGLSKSTARSAAEALTFSPYLVPSVGGWRLKNDA
jgi:hypothetical protein